MEKFCYKKIYKQVDGCVTLINPDMAIKYNEEKIRGLYASTNPTEMRQRKLQMLKEFQQIYKYDIEHAIRPELFGFFQTDEDKKKFSNTKQLIDDLGLYIGNIFFSYHEDLYQLRHYIPLVRLPIMVVDYNELYDCAIREYYRVMLGIEHPVKVREKEEVCESNRSAIPKGKHAPTATFILPSLIEAFLEIELQNRMLFQNLKKIQTLILNKENSLSKEEEMLCGAFLSGEESRTFLENRESIMGKMYRIFVKYATLKEDTENQLILTGRVVKKKGGTLSETLGTMLRTSYAESQIAPEYYWLLRQLFDVDKVNFRNNVMHAGFATYDYLDIRFVSIMLQLIWDIASHDMFVDQ